MEKEWRLKATVNQDTLSQLMEQLKVDGKQLDEKIAILLLHCGIDSFDKAKQFFRHELSQLHDPFLMKGMKVAVERIHRAIDNHEGILVYGDYDVDGTTAVALTYSFLSQFHDKLDYYIPNRNDEGYGISFKGVDYAASKGHTLIIALDCGIKSNDKVIYAKEKGIDFIICDHHLPGEEIPNAVAVLDPKQMDCNYPFKELSGCGLGYKLAQAYLASKEYSVEQIAEAMNPHLDLVAVSIASDLVPLVSENRVLAHYGLQIFNQKIRPGIKAILDLAQIDKNLGFIDLGYSIGPKINAAGRLENGQQAVALLLAKTYEEAVTLATKINVTNDHRKDLDSKITEEALGVLLDDPKLNDKKSTVLYNENWHKGVVGIVASRVIEKHYRPTVILTASNGLATGSARSVKNFNVYEAIASCADLLQQFGGHQFAAGLSLKIENIAAFQERFEEVVSRTIGQDALVPEIEYDCELNLKEIQPKFLRILKQFAPFGMGNPAPLFVAHDITDIGKVYIMGKNHLRMEVIQDQDTFLSFPAVGFGLKEYFEPLYAGKPFSMVYSIEENEWKGKVTVQLNIKDIRLK